MANAILLFARRSNGIRMGSCGAICVHCRPLLQTSSWLAVLAPVFCPVHINRCLLRAIYPGFVGEIVFWKAGEWTRIIWCHNIDFVVLTIFFRVLRRLCYQIEQRYFPPKKNALSPLQTPSPHPRRYPFDLRFISSNYRKFILSYVACLSCVLVFPYFGFRSLQRVSLAAVEKCGAKWNF